MQKRIGRKQALYWFDSLRELSDWVDSTPRTWAYNKSQEKPPSHDWDLYTNYAKTIELSRNGWIEGASKMQEALKVFSPSTPAPDSKVDFYGHMPHVPRFCAGAPDNMIRHSPAPTMGGGRVLTLIVQTDAAGGVSGEYTANYGVAIAQYVNQLETSGIRVELIGAISGIISGWRVSHCWRIKSADQPLDLAVVAFAIGHPAMFRRLGFALLERSAAPQASGYGQPEAVKLDDCINAPSGAIVLNGMYNAHTTSRTPKKALESVTAQIEAALIDNNAE